MKGFIYLIEIAVAAILMTVVLTVFFSIRIKQDWVRADLIAAGNNILNSIRNSNDSFLNILSENLTDIELSKPENIKYGLKILGSPKSKISIGCYINCEYLKDLLSSSPIYGGSIFVNERWINFTVDPFDINSEIPPFDVVVLINYTNYSDNTNTIKSRIDNYTKSGGVVIGINSTASINQNFLDIYNLTGGSGSSSTVNFTFYDPSRDEIAKYFMGIGMDAYSSWYIWESQWRIDYWGSNKINITNVLDEAINRTNLMEGSNFSLTGPDSKTYFFKVKKIWYPNRVDFQVLNKTFVFKDFSESSNPVRGTNIVGYSSYAALTTNNSAVWISDFPKSDEYRTLLKAAILSRVDEWAAKGVYTTKEKTTVSSFTSLCCDMPETAELYLTLWYEI